MRILLCGLLKYPAGDAGSVRQEKLAQLLMRLDHKVMVIGLGAANGGKMETCNGVVYTSFRSDKPGMVGKVQSHLRYWKKLKQMIETYKAEAVLAYDIGPGNMQKLKKLCRKKGILLIHDSVEWYSPEQFRWGKLAWSYRRKDRLNRRVIDQNCRCIAISKYLQQHFQSKGIQTVNIPIMVTPEDICREKHLLEEKVVFTYAGQPGKKDYLHVMLDAFLLLPEDLREKAVFHIVGCTAQQMVAAGISEAVLDQLAPQLEVHGRVPRASVLELLKKTDFTLLMRSAEQRYAKAGFPTKVVESLSTATPVICNLTSDLADYLTDGADSLIVENDSAEALRIQMEKAIRLTKEQRENMCNHAAYTAERCFLYTNYSKQMQTILQ